MAATKTEVVKKETISSFLLNDAVKKNVANVVGEKDCQGFISAVISTVQTTPALAECTPKSILNAALIGHALNLPQSPQLGYYYLVPYNNKKENCKEAQFQMGYRGYIQLALRTGQYRKIHVTDIREGELKSYDPINDEYRFEAITDFNKRNALPVVGYYAFFEYLNGGRKGLYWSKEKMLAHADKYSSAFSVKATNGKYPKVSYADYLAGKVKEKDMWLYSSFWYQDFDAMAYKTMIRQLISKWGLTTPNSPASTSMDLAYRADMAVIDDQGQPVYVDSIPTETIDSVQAETTNEVAAEIGSIEDPAKDQMESGEVEGEQAKMPGF